MLVLQKLPECVPVFRVLVKAVAVMMIVRKGRFVKEYEDIRLVASRQVRCQPGQQFWYNVTISACIVAVYVRSVALIRAAIPVDVQRDEVSITIIPGIVHPFCTRGAILVCKVLQWCSDTITIVIFISQPLHIHTCFGIVVADERIPEVIRAKVSVNLSTILWNRVIDISGRDVEDARVAEYVVNRLQDSAEGLMLVTHITRYCEVEALCIDRCAQHRQTEQT